MKKLIPLLLTAVMLGLTLSSCTIDLNAVSIKYKQIEGGWAVSSYTDKTTVTELVIPDEIDSLPVLEVSDFGVCNAESLVKITIGKNVERIGSWAFTNNQHVQEYIVDPENGYFTSEDGVLFNKDMTELIAYPCGRNIEFDRYGQAQNTTEYAIPDGVKIVGSKAFYKCYYVDVTYFPDSIERIEEKAFHKTSELTDFDMPESLQFIGKDAFAYDEHLTELTIHGNIKEIEEYAFYNCTGMTKLTVEAEESGLTLGKKWQPTEKGKVSENCEVIFKK